MFVFVGNTGSDERSFDSGRWVHVRSGSDKGMVSEWARYVADDKPEDGRLQSHT